MADRGQGFDFPEPEAFGPQSVSDPFAPGTEGTPEPGEERGALEVAEPINEPRMLGRDKTQVQAGSMVNQQAIAEAEAQAEAEQMQAEAQMAEQQAAAEADVEGEETEDEEAMTRPERESKTTKAFLSGSLFLFLFPPYGVYKLMKPFLAGGPEDIARVTSMIPGMCYPEMAISSFMLIKTLKYQKEYAPYSQGKKTIAQFLIVTMPWIWWTIILIALIALLVMMILISICNSGTVEAAVCWWYDIPTGIK